MTQSFWQRLLYGKQEQERKYDSLDLWKEIYGSRTSSSGVTINWAKALEVSTVLACCKVIAEGIAQVPFKVFKDDGTDIRKAQDQHYLYPLIYRRPNRWQTSFEFRETIAFHALLFGNAYVFLGKVGMAREIREMVPLEPNHVTVRRIEGGALEYTYQPVDGQRAVFSQDQIWHLRGASWNARCGMDAIALAREAIGLAIATENAHADMHKGGARLSGVYSVDGNMSKDQYAFISEWLDKYAMGGDRAGKPMILDRGAKWASQQMSGVDSQHLETRKFQIEEICRGFRVMPIMVGYSDKAATYASAEQMFLAHVVHCLAPWYERIEQSADVNLFTDDERKQGFYTKFIPNALMRGAAKDRAEYYAKALGSGGSAGWMTPNEIRALEEMSSHPDGDELPKPAAAEPVAPPPAA